MRIACFSDVHGAIRKEFDEISDKSGSTRLDLVVDGLNYIKDYCVEDDIPVAVCAGDVFHTRGKVSTRVYNSMYNALKGFPESGIDLVIIPGNHDQIDNSDTPQHSLLPFKEIEGISILDEMGEIFLYDEQVSFMAVPFSKNAELVKETIKGLSEQSMTMDEKCILIAHLGVSGAVIGGDYVMQDAYNLEDLMTDSFKYVVLGHYHEKQMLNHNTFYTGSPIPHDFGDVDVKGFFVVDTDKRYDVNFVPIPSPKFVTIQGAEVTRKQLQEYKDNRDFLRIKIDESELDDLNSKIPEGLKYKIELTRQYDTESRSDITIGMNFEDIVSKYAEHYGEDEKIKQVGLDLLREAQETL